MSGRVDHSTAADFESALNNLLDELFKSSGQNLVVDLTNVEFVSSAGLRILLNATKTIKGQSGKLVVANPNSIVREVITISKFDLVFPVHDSVKEALLDVSPAAAEIYNNN
ncbi:MAG: STAS domain-containing protein [Gammaproteobacteria bacterium]